ncbi:MAG: hypothetical protein PHO67_07835 [Candidatus Omnitrophica bacterium]|nr:hypothetical protein [Candidatus Omnitrophota bacterium]
MKCPDCKDKELLPARSREDCKEVDALKCSYCSKMFQMNESNHLRPLEPQAATHTAAILTSAPVKPEILEQAARIAEHSLKQTGRDRPRTYHKLSKEEIDIAVARLKKGDRPVDIAHDLKCDAAAIGWHKKKLVKAGSITSHKYRRENKKPPAPAINPPKKPAKPINNIVYDNTHRGNLALQMLRLKRGELRPETTKTVIRRYHAMLQYDLDKAQATVRKIKQEMAPINDALREIDIIEQGEKAIIEKVLASVRK